MEMNEIFEKGNFFQKGKIVKVLKSSSDYYYYRFNYNGQFITLKIDKKLDNSFLEVEDGVFLTGFLNVKDVLKGGEYLQMVHVFVLNIKKERQKSVQL